MLEWTDKLNSESEIRILKIIPVLFNIRNTFIDTTKQSKKQNKYIHTP